MRYVAAALSCVALGAGAQAQSLDWQGLLQHGVNEAIRSIQTPQQAPAPTPAPARKSAPASATPQSSSSTTRPSTARPVQARQTSPSKQTSSTPAPSTARETVNARLVDNLRVTPAEFQRFFDRLKTEVAAGNRKALANMVHYPLGVGGSEIKVFTKADFLTHYDSIFTPSVEAAVRDQAYETLFVRDTGAAFGDGLLWVSGSCMDSGCARRALKVITVNPPDDERTVQLPTAVRPSAGKDVLLGTSLPEGAPGSSGPCRELPPVTGSITVAGSVPPDDMHCYRLVGHSGQTVHVELKSLNTGFTIETLADNRSDLTFKAKNQPYDILLGQTLRSVGDDYYEMRVTVR